MTVSDVLDRIREDKGPFFVARLGLRLNFSPLKESHSDSLQLLHEIIRACRDLGYEPPLDVTDR